MRLDGLGLLLAFALLVAWGVIVDLALVAKLFRYRAALAIGSIVALIAVFLFLHQANSPSERTGLFKGTPGGADLVMMVMTSAVFMPFIVIAPFAQYLSMRDDQRWPGWITAWMALQVALIPAFVVLALTERHFWQQEFAAGQAEGREARAGGLGRILERAEQRRERIWGTGWTLPLQPNPSGGFPIRDSGWRVGLAKALEASPPITSSEPLSPPDRAAVQTLLRRHFSGYAVPHIRVKLAWDELKPGNFSAQLTPKSDVAPRLVGEEEVPVLLDRLEKHGCPGGRMMQADRAALNEIVLAKGRQWNVDTRTYEMRPDWAGYPQRVEKLCSG